MIKMSPTIKLKKNYIELEDHKIFSRAFIKKDNKGHWEYDSKGVPCIDYNLENADKYGFDKRYKLIDKGIYNGCYKKIMLIPKGTRLIRYATKKLYTNNGVPADPGRFLSPEGTEYEEISLPYLKTSVQMYKYEVTADYVETYLIATAGLAAPGFEKPGGGVQYYLLDKNIAELLQSGALKLIQEESK